MITYQDLSPTLRAFIGTHAVLRLLGIPSEAIFVYAAPSARLNGSLGGFIEIRTENTARQEVRFSIELGSVESEQAFGDGYTRVAHAINANEFSEDDFRRCFEECEARNDVVTLIMAMQVKGIDVAVDPRAPLSPADGAGTEPSNLN